MPRRTPPSVDLKPYFLVADDVLKEYDGKLDWPRFFGNSNPVEIDVGCGRGLFLVRAGEAHPDRNFLGIEIDYKEGRRGAMRIKKRVWPHVRVLGGDVHYVFSHLIEPYSVDAVHVYFPDPWWKKRHHKRRVFTDKFADLCARILKPGGELHSWTDVSDYFEVISALLDHHEDFETLSPPAEHSAEHDLDYQTSFERKKRKLGLPIFRGRWRRRPFNSSISESL